MNAEETKKQEESAPYPSQEVLTFPQAAPQTITGEAQAHYSRARDGIPVLTAPESAPIDHDQTAAKNLIQLVRQLSTGSAEERETLFKELKGKDDVEIEQIAAKISRGITLDAQNYLNQAQKLAKERQEQIALSTKQETTGIVSKISNWFKGNKTAA